MNQLCHVGADEANTISHHEIDVCKARANSYTLLSANRASAGGA